MYSLPTNLTNVQDFFVYVSTTGSGGVFGMMIPIVVFFVLLLALFDRIDTMSIAVSALLTSFASLFLSMMGMVSISEFIIPFSLGLILLSVSWWSSLHK